MGKQNTENSERETFLSQSHPPSPLAMAGQAEKTQRKNHLLYKIETLFFLCGSSELVRLWRA